MMPAQSSGVASASAMRVGQRVGEVLAHDGVLGVAAVGVVAGEARLRAEVLVAAPAVRADAAGAAQPGDADALRRRRSGRQPGPSASTTPTTWWPGMTRARCGGSSPSTTCRSVRQMPQTRTRTRISPGPGSGIGRSTRCSGRALDRRRLLEHHGAHERDCAARVVDRRQGCPRTRGRPECDLIEQRCAGWQAAASAASMPARYGLRGSTPRGGSRRQATLTPRRRGRLPLPASSRAATWRVALPLFLLLLAIYVAQLPPARRGRQHSDPAAAVQPPARGQPRTSTSSPGSATRAADLPVLRPPPRRRTSTRCRPSPRRWSSRRSTCCRRGGWRTTGIAYDDVRARVIDGGHGAHRGGDADRALRRLLFVVLRRLTTWRWALALTLIYGLGTSTWSISSQALWAHGLSAALRW